MNYFTILENYVKTFDDEKKEALRAAQSDLQVIADAVDGSDLTADIFQTAFMLTQYATYSEAVSGHFDEFVKDSIKATIMADDYLSYSDEYMDNDGLDEYISNLEPLEAFRLGQFSRINYCDHYFMLDGYANIQSVSESDIEEAAKNDSEFIESRFDEITNDCEDYNATADMIAELATVLVKAGY